jgi:hypothetical protein
MVDTGQETNQDEERPSEKEEYYQASCIGISPVLFNFVWLPNTEGNFRPGLKDAWFVSCDVEGLGYTFHYFCKVPTHQVSDVPVFNHGALFGEAGSLIQRYGRVTDVKRRNDVAGLVELLASTIIPKVIDHERAIH